MPIILDGNRWSSGGQYYENIRPFGPPADKRDLAAKSENLHILKFLSVTVSMI